MCAQTHATPVQLAPAQANEELLTKQNCVEFLSSKNGREPGSNGIESSLLTFMHGTHASNLVN
jgi:hypothetical protein